MATPRFHRLNSILDRRQMDLTVCMEHVNKPHNLSAVVRTADAVGVHDLHAIWEDSELKRSNFYSSGSNNWTRIHRHVDIETAISTLKAQNMQVLATHLSDNSVDFRDIDYAKPTAILLGTERFGISQTALDLSDQHIVIPMMGMVQSLNVSVASALILYEAQRQRDIAGMYQQPPKIEYEERQRLLFEGCHEALFRRCRQKGLPFPVIDDQGEVCASEDWWASMRS
ncbi:tRNA (guanosine(18)-2'-O)-methyltransferase TrmH [Echinimonas agarilytica]|uniref:tRNA (guanosine(18)-2'-O)-methyltransferase n=1 Tax=Echinimonas agarilytica TaxID=1215918 RepID=A0AA41WAL6_9GAMM|nr:tRNA (guanosine(18)-2'-O)-methyltransferase TrmH [Echinimonas agarilytica]MCM2681006.1 tRNA (guanosine(18)-2'-O)-methyltransferase TrmH [Echinimonas agarilytica]